MDELTYTSKGARLLQKVCAESRARAAIRYTVRPYRHGYQVFDGDQPAHLQYWSSIEAITRRWADQLNAQHAAFIAAGRRALREVGP